MLRRFAKVRGWIFTVRYGSAPVRASIIRNTRINSAGALLAGRGQYSTVKNGTRMRYGTVVRLVYSGGFIDISAAVQMGGILLVLVLVLVALYWDRMEGQRQGRVTRTRRVK